MHYGRTHDGDPAARAYTSSAVGSNALSQCVTLGSSEQ
jgi:hypothetical protein